MSRIESEAKPALIPTIDGDFAVLSEADKARMAEWAVLKFMVTDQMRPDDAAIMQEERSEFRLHRTIPSGFRVWVFYCGEPGFDCFYNQHSARIFRAPPPPVLPAGKNIKTFGLGFGHALFFAFYVQDPRLYDDLILDFRGGNMRIWPPQEGPVIWPPKLRLSRQGAFDILDTMSKLIQSPQTGWLS